MVGFTWLKHIATHLLMKDHVENLLAFVKCSTLNTLNDFKPVILLHDAACQVKGPFKDATSKHTASNG